MSDKDVIARALAIQSKKSSAKNEILINEVEKYTNTSTPHIITLVGGQPDEITGAGGNISGTGCTISVDTTNYRINKRAWRGTISVAGTSTFIVDPISLSEEDPMKIPKIAVVGLWVYIDDSTKISTLSLQLYNKADLTNAWSGGIEALKHTLTNGWNLIRFPIGILADPLLMGWSALYRVRITIVSSSPTYFTVGQIFLEANEKAQILLVDDASFRSFYTLAYPEFKKRGIPITWATQMYRFISNDPLYITLEMLDEVAKENNNSISFHSYGTPYTLSNASTPDEVASENMRAIKWLERRGHRPVWRSAWLQNQCQNYASATGLFVACATATSSDSVRVGCFPPTNRHNIPRVGIHGYSDAIITSLFAQLELSRGFVVMYTHGIHVAGGNDMTPTQLARFLELSDAGINGGWLEFVTMEQMLARSGVKIRQGFGDWVTEFYSNGVPVVERLP
jgi:hypothetical protein